MGDDEKSEEKRSLKGRAADQFGALRKTLIGSFGIMVVALTLASALQYLYNLIMTRMLPEHGLYGKFASANSLFLIIVIASASLQVVITKYVAQYTAMGEPEKVHVLARSFSKWFIYVGVAVILVSAAVSWPLARALNYPSPLIVILLGLCIATSIYITLPNGMLQGQQKFVGLGVASISMAICRIAFGVGMVLIGFELYGALGAAALSTIVVGAAILYYYRDTFRGPVQHVEDFHPTHALWYLVPVAVTTFAIILMTQIDVVLVGALFKAHPKMVDTYSYGALAGKAVLFFPEAIVVVMFPRVSELRAKGESTRRVLFLSLAAVIVMVGAVAGFFALFPDFTAKVFGGDNWRSLVSPVNNGLFGLKFVVLFGLVMAIFSLCRLLAMYHLAMERKWFIATYLIAAAVEIAGIFVFHDKLSDVLTVMLCVGVVLLAINLALALFESSPHEGSAGVQGEAGIAD